MGDMVEKKESSAGAKVDSQCFWLERVFPDASAGFSFQQRSVEEIKEKCIVILDANVLLMPYRLGAHSLGELKSVYRDLAEKKRLAIPAQAARELLIWKTILKLGADRKSDAIFVTEDAKSDWWVQSEGAFQPRIELVEEYRLASNGQTIQLMPLSSLLKLFGAEQGSVEEAKQVESARRAREALIAERNRQENLSVEAGGVTTEEEIDGDLPSLILLNQQLWKRLNEVTLELSRLRRRMNEQGENLSPVELAQAFDRRDSLSAEQTSLFRRRREIEERMRRLAK